MRGPGRIEAGTAGHWGRGSLDTPWGGAICLLAQPALDAPRRLGEASAKAVVTASTGGHGLAVAFAVRSLGVHATIFVSPEANPDKVSVIKDLGGEVVAVGEDEPLSGLVAGGRG